jgi:hypothetical protein
MQPQHFGWHQAALLKCPAGVHNKFMHGLHIPPIPDSDSVEYTTQYNQPQNSSS